MKDKAEPTETPDESGDEETTETSPEEEEVAEEDEKTEREKMYENYPENSESEKEDEETDTSASEEDGNKEEGTTEPSAEKGETDSSTDLEETPESKIKPEERTVPHGAFHAEREKRKEVERELRELKSQKEHESDYEEEIPIEDYDSEINTLKRKVTDLERRDSDRETERNEDIRIKNREKVDKIISATDKSLEEEGYPGFMDYEKIVTAEITELAQKEPDPELRRKYLSGELQYPKDTPEGWKEVYKEKVYPKYHKLHLAQDKNSLMDKKKSLKKKASLVNSPGTQHVKPEEDENNESDKEAFDSYMQGRRNDGKVLAKK